MKNIITAVLVLGLTGCAGIKRAGKGAVIGGALGLPGIEYNQKEGQIKSTDLSKQERKAFALGAGSCLNTAMTVILFYAFPPAGFVYVGANAAAGAYIFGKQKQEQEEVK